MTAKILIESLDHIGRGVGHFQGKVIFVEGALQGEIVEFSSYKKKSKYEIASVKHLFKSSAYRVTPKCTYFDTCGGCSMQHLEASVQSAVKQRVLEDAFWHLAKVRPEMMYPLIQGAAWGYRFRARLGALFFQSQAKVLLGFHKKRSNHIVDIDSCAVLPAKISVLLPALKALISRLSRPDSVPQVEVAIGEEGTALVLRHLQALSEQDKINLRTFADAHAICFFLQPGSVETVHLFYPETVSLSYFLPEFDVRLGFLPTDFTQVNDGMNAVLVRRAIALLNPQPGERIADMFCGLGNFTLPIARRGASVVGVEGCATLVERARENARANQLEQHASFVTKNLFSTTPESLVQFGKLDKMLIDPPREGAMALVEALSTSSKGQQSRPQRIVYVSCNPATLARDAGILVHNKGYKLRGAGIINMFPHTSHVESLALFEC